MSKRTYNLIVITLHSPKTAASVVNKIDDLYLKNKLEPSDYIQVSAIDNKELLVRQSSLLTLNGFESANPLWQPLVSLLYWSNSSKGMLQIALKLLKKQVITAGISQEFIEKVGQAVQTSSDAIFVLLRQEHFESLTQSLAQLDAELFYTTLDNTSLTAVSAALVDPHA